VFRNPSSPWTLIVAYVQKGFHERLLTEKISDETAPDGWKTFEIDLPEGKWVLPLGLTSWYDEKDQAPAYWSHIDIVEVEQ
jgi:hypothetical protein